MIGVISRPAEAAAVEEFFQLFKTPWEPFQGDHVYEIILATAEDIPEADAKLLLLFGSQSKSCDHLKGIRAGRRCRGATLDQEGPGLPIFGEALTFAESAGWSVCIGGDCGIVGLRNDSGGRAEIRLGYDLFNEIAFLLSVGQPVENALIPTLELHIQLLRKWILGAGITIVEISPSPAGYDFAVCLTHDIDFVGIRRHKWDHTIAGFLYRATFGALRDCVRGRQPVGRLLRNWWAAASLPLVYLGWAKDFWLHFDTYLQIEKDLSATYYFIPFKNRAGENLKVKHPKRRASAYDITDIPDWIDTLKREGCEIAVHGIDAWHSVEKGRDELRRVAVAAQATDIGIRMHWLLRNEATMRVLEEAGYDYDSTMGYNETVGYRCGSSQVFRPLETRRLLELPMHLQDGALFYPQRLALSETEAWALCEMLINRTKKTGGVLTVLWHDRSLGPERFWGGFYVKLVRHLRSLNVWFARAGQVVSWFRKRREVVFERMAGCSNAHHLKLHSPSGKMAPGLAVRIHRPGLAGAQSTVLEIAWTGEADLEIPDQGHFTVASTPEPFPTGPVPR